MRGRGGLVSSMAHFTREINVGISLFPEKDSIPLSQEIHSDLVPSLIPVPERGTSPNAYLVSAPKESSTLVSLLNPKGPVSP